MTDDLDQPAFQIQITKRHVLLFVLGSIAVLLLSVKPPNLELDSSYEDPGGTAEEGQGTLGAGVDDTADAFALEDGVNVLDLSKLSGDTVVGGKASEESYLLEEPSSSPTPEEEPAEPEPAAEPVEDSPEQEELPPGDQDEEKDEEGRTRGGASPVKKKLTRREEKRRQEERRERNWAKREHHYDNPANATKTFDRHMGGRLGAVSEDEQGGGGGGGGGAVADITREVQALKAGSMKDAIEENDEGEEDDEEDEEDEEKGASGEKAYRVSGYHDCNREREAHPDLGGISIGFPKKMNRTDVFVHQGNYQKILKGDLAMHSRKGYTFLPKDGASISRAYMFRSCAVVGNGGGLKVSGFGKTIDFHDVVVRLNQAPTEHYKKFVGTKTTFRMMNRLWTAHYGTGRFVEMGLPMERGLTIVVSRTDGYHFEKMHRTIKGYRPDVALLYLSSRVVAAARKLLVQYRVRLCQAGYGPYSGGSTPSSGYVAIYLLMHLCQTLSVYGFGKSRYHGENLPYHYYTGTGSRKEGDSVHSFSAEEALITELGKEKRLTLCNYKEFNATCTDRTCEKESAVHRHNKICGFNPFLGQEAVNEALRTSYKGFDPNSFYGTSGFEQMQDIYGVGRTRHRRRHAVRRRRRNRRRNT